MFKDVMKAFLGMKEQEAILSAQGAKKAGILVVSRFCYGLLDYIIAGGLGVVVVWMNSIDCSNGEILMATFLYDLMASYLFYFLSDKSGYDITLGNSLRRAADAMFRNGIFGRILGGLLLLGVSVKAIIWEGPEVICFLFRKELNTRPMFHVAMICLSFLQAIFGSWLYTTGYKLAMDYLDSLKLNLGVLEIVFLGIGIFVAFIAFSIVAKWVTRGLSALVHWIKG